TYTGLPDTTLRTLYSEGYITPTLLQLFTDTTAGRGVLTYGNADLGPETSRNIEIGTRYNGDGLTLDAAAFYTKAKGYITSVPCTNDTACPTDWGSGDFIHVNADGATTYGVELAADYLLPNTSFTAYVAGAWMRRKLEFSTWSTYDSDTPSLAGRMGMRWEGEVADAPAWADLFVRGSDGVTLAMDKGGVTVDRLPSWGTLNFAFGGSFGEDDRFRVGVHFNNILNKEYRSSFDELPGTGRSVDVTAQAKF
ncbi:MAG: TonB-dependent receptor, partial [Pseudomonadota bacterium]|nr:TonB-dependent receptor [Pseudomonadota bacterium]